MDTIRIPEDIPCLNCSGTLTRKPYNIFKCSNCECFHFDIQEFILYDELKYSHYDICFRWIEARKALQKEYVKAYTSTEKQDESFYTNLKELNSNYKLLTKALQEKFSELLLHSCS
jgi:hypothetical protein